MADGTPQSGSGLFKAPQDVLCGLMFIIIGIGGVWIGWDYPRGTSVRLGTGVFPALLSWGLIIIGAIVFVQGMLVSGPPLGRIAWRPVIMIAIAASAFAVLIETAGLLTATLVMMIIAAFAGENHSMREFTIFSVIMLIMAWVMFILILDMPIKVFPWS